MVIGIEHQIFNCEADIPLIIQSELCNSRLYFQDCESYV